MAPILPTTSIHSVHTLLARQYYYYTSPGLSTGAIAGIAIASILILALGIAGCARRARYGSYYGPSAYPTRQPYAYRTADGQPMMPIYSTASGNPAYPQTELNQTAPRMPDAAVVAGGRPPAYGGNNATDAAAANESSYYAPRRGEK